MLAIGQFFLSLFSSDCIVNVVNNITSDVLYKIYKILYHWFSLYAVFKVHKDASGCKNSSALKACFHKQVCFCRHWHVMPWAIRPEVLELRICFWLIVYQSSEPKTSFELWSLVNPAFNSTSLLIGLAAISCCSSLPVFIFKLWQRICLRSFFF